MLKYFMWAGVALAVVIAAGLLFATTISDDFRVSRSVQIKASAEKIFPLIDDLRQFDTWNPFAKQDPSIRITYSGPDHGAGAANAFDSNRAGKGRLEIIGSTPSSKVEMMLHMEKPIEGHNKIVFTLEPREGATEVTWTMSGERPYIGKVLSMVFSMEKMVGTPFEQGLADLKSRAEK